MRDAPRLATLTRVLARHGQMSDLLPQLHQYAVETAGGSCSVLLQSSPRTGLLHPTSAFGLDYLPTAPWLTGEAEARLGRTVLEGHEPVAVTGLHTRHPELAGQLGTPDALLLPLAGLDRPLGLVVIGLSTPPSPDAGPQLAPVIDAFVLAIERMRLRRDAELQRSVRELMHDFSLSVSKALSLRAGLEIVCDGAARLFGADCTEIWLHDRTNGTLKLDASSGSVPVTDDRVMADDLHHPAALAMRSEGARIFEPEQEPGPPHVGVGLRGRRRALGTLVLASMRIEPGEEVEVLARVEEVGRQLSAAIENTQLLEQVLQRRLTPG